jgi:hypothetical protein
MEQAPAQSPARRSDPRRLVALGATLTFVCAAFAAMLWLTSDPIRREMVFVLAVVPNPVFDLAGVAAGALRMPVGGYLAAVATGKVIKNVAIAGGASMIGGLMAAITPNPL